MLSRCYPGDGGYPRSIIAGLVAGEDGGFLSLTNAALVSGKRRLSQLFLRRFFGHGEWRLTKLRPAVLEP
ncbi:unnamed protein product [Brassica rapa subsp. narinosa]